MKKFYFKIIAALCCAIFSSCQTVEDAREAQKETSLVLGERTASPEEFGIKKRRMLRLGIFGKSCGGGESPRISGAPISNMAAARA